MTDPRTPLDEERLREVTGGYGERPPPGTNNPDAMSGTNFSEGMSGLGGGDHMSGMGGNDTMLGGAGGDRMDGGDGADLMAGGTEADQVSGGAGDDMILWSPGEGNDQVIGGAGFDTLRVEGAVQPGDLVFTLDAGSAQPVLENGVWNVAGVSGSFTLGGETVTFRELEQITFQAAKTNIWGR